MADFSESAGSTARDSKAMLAGIKFRMDINAIDESSNNTVGARMIL